MKTITGIVHPITLANRRHESKAFNIQTGPVQANVIEESRRLKMRQKGLSLGRGHSERMK